MILHCPHVKIEALHEIRVSELTNWWGFLEKAETILGRERMRLQTMFHDRLTQEAKANGFAGNRRRMFWRRSSFIEAMNAISVFLDFSIFFFFFVYHFRREVMMYLVLLRRMYLGFFSSTNDIGLFINRPSFIFFDIRPSILILFVPNAFDMI